MKILIVVNDPAYGSERPFNALRLAGELARRDGVQLQVFLMGDAVTCAIAGQSVSNGYYHLDRMLTSVARHGGTVGCCGTCLDARVIQKEQLVEAAARSSMSELAGWTLDADRVLVF